MPHFLHQGAVLVQQFLKVEQAFKVAKSFLDLHAHLIDRQIFFCLQVCHYPQQIGKAFLPDPDHIHERLALVEDLVQDAGFARLDARCHRFVFSIAEIRSHFQPDHEVHLFLSQGGQKFQVAELSIQQCTHRQRN